MKLLTIVPYNIFPAKVGGQKAIAIFNEFLAKETQLICVTVKSNSPAYAKGYTIFNTISNSVFRYINPFLFFKLRSIINKNGITHISIEHPYFGWLGFLLKIFCNVKLIVRSHNIEAIRWKSLGKWWWKIMWHYEKFVHRHADINFFITDEDRLYAEQMYEVKSETCTMITYGIEWSVSPTVAEKLNCRNHLLQQYEIEEKAIIFLFNGSLDYKPNLDAVKIILNDINPLLIQSDIPYKIIICGSNLPVELNDLKSFADKNIIYAGFVNDIKVYFKGADVFINPVVDGGGIKTKLVEAIGFGTPAISSQSGAIGVSQSVTGNMLTIVKDMDWENFANQMKHLNHQQTTPETFYNQFYWGNIAAKAIRFIEK